MNVIGLVSGGKDNCLAMMERLEYGHKVIALANLLLANDCMDALDSYIYVLHCFSQAANCDRFCHLGVKHGCYSKTFMFMGVLTRWRAANCDRLCHLGVKHVCYSKTIMFTRVLTR